MIFGATEISNAALSSADVPDPNGPLDMRQLDEFPPILVFAKTYSPPLAMPEHVPELVAQSALTHWQAQGELPEIGLDGLRLALWWISEHWRHNQSHGPYEQGYPREAAFARALVKQINQFVYQEEAWWWEPEHEPTDEERWERALDRSNENRDLVELYELAAEMLTQAIGRRDAGSDDPMHVPLEEEDPLRASRIYVAHLIAHGLVGTNGGRSLEEAQDEALRWASSLTAYH